VHDWASLRFVTWVIYYLCCA